MSPVLPVLAVAERDGHRLRAYAADARRPTLPVLSAADLARAIMPTRDDEVELLAALPHGALASLVSTALTEDGPTLVIAHSAAFLLIALFDGLAIAPERTASGEALLADAVIEGTLAQTDGLPLGRRRAWMWRAWRRDKARFARLLRSARSEVGSRAPPEAWS